MTHPYTLPNLLTLLRIALVPAVVVLFYADELGFGMERGWAAMACGLMFAAAGITDSFDGWLARRWGQVTPLGAFLDPVADKLIVAVALVLIVSHDPRWFVTLTAAVIIGREITVSALREWMAEIGARRKVAVSVLGKYKTILQIVGLSLMLFREDLFGIPVYDLGTVLTIVAAALTLWSMAVYLRAAWPSLRSAPPA